MIKYNSLSLKNNYLSIDISVEDKSYYEKTIFKGVRIDTPDTYGTDTPYEEKIVLGNPQRWGAQIFLPKSDLYIITPQVELNLDSDIPCGADVINKSAVYDKTIIKDKGLLYLKEIGDTCNISKNFIDFYLKQKALDLAISTCNIAEAIKYWNMINSTTTVTSKGCGCYGR